MFFYEVEGHMPKLSSFGRGKTTRPKKSLTRFLHAALHLYDPWAIFGQFLKNLLISSQNAWKSLEKLLKFSLFMLFTQ